MCNKNVMEHLEKREWLRCYVRKNNTASLNVLSSTGFLKEERFTYDTDYLFVANWELVHKKVFKKGEEELFRWR